MSNIVFYCEGDTEESILTVIMRPYVEQLRSRRVGVHVRNLGGVSNFLKEIGPAAQRSLANGATAVFGLVDLYQAVRDFPPDCTDLQERVQYVRDQMIRSVPPALRSRFHPHVAVHETEAWLLADDAALTQVLKTGVGPWPTPETVDSQTPPAAVLNSLYRRHRKRQYQKVPDGAVLANKVDAGVIYRKCPFFHSLVDELLAVGDDGVGGVAAG